MKKFSCCIPVYNRETEVLNALASLEAQTFKNFEVLVINDGSTDGTEKNILDYKTKSKMDIKYCYKQNGGKHTALNVAFEMADSEFFIILDSDDKYLPFTLERLLTLWEQIPENERKDYSGVMGRSCLPNGQIHGRRFPWDPFVSSYIDFHYISGSKYGPFGDCCEFIRTDLVKQFRFPEYAGEKFLVECYVTDQIGMEYKLYCTNAILMEHEYLNDGLTQNILKHKLNSIKGTILNLIFIIEEVLDNPRFKYKIPFAKKCRIVTNYYRFSLHDKNKKAQRAEDVHPPLQICLILGLLYYLRDKFQMSHK